MLTGARPEYHRISWNDRSRFVYSDVPTIFEQAHKVNGEDGKPLTTCMVAGKIKFQEFERPGTIDYSEVYRDGEGSDDAIGQSAAHMIRRHAPRVMFVHLPNVDSKGHATGWGSPQQMDAIEKADDAVGLILSAMDEQGLTSTTAIILSADHGGQGAAGGNTGVHGPNDPRSRHIPWIIAGPGIKRNYDLTRLGSLIINTEDTFATACTLMNLPLPEYLDGKFVSQIVQPRELLEEKSTAAKVVDIDEWWKPPAYKWEPTPIPSHHN